MKLATRTQSSLQSIKSHKQSKGPMGQGRGEAVTRPSQSSQPCTNPQNNSINGNKELITSVISEIYSSLFDSDEMSLQLDFDQYDAKGLYSRISTQILSQIERLHKIQEEYSQMLRVFQTNPSKMTTEQKWKLVVMSYRTKIGSLQSRVQQDKKNRQILEQTIRVHTQEKDRLTSLNNLKFNKINTLLTEKEGIESQVSELNSTVQLLQNNIEQIKETNSLLQSQIFQSSKVNEELAAELEGAREKTLMNEEQRNVLSGQMKVLGEQEESVNKQVQDLKMKHQIQIAQLDHKIAVLCIQEQQYLLQIQQFERRNQFVKESVAVQTQTEVQITTKACFFNSLANQLDDESYTEGDQDLSFQGNSNQDQLQLGKNQRELQSDGEEEPDLFSIPIGSVSASNHLVYTDRPPKLKKSDVLSQKQANLRKSQISFDDAQSMMSNTQSRCMQTMTELTSSLSQAYGKINELTEKIHNLENEKVKVERRLHEKEQKSKIEVKAPPKNYFSTFFRK